MYKEKIIEKGGNTEEHFQVETEIDLDTEEQTLIENVFIP